MDKKELLQQLVQMKKEYDKKRKKLQLAMRVKNAREHVKRKIQEQNELTTDEGSFQDESYNGDVSLPIVLSPKEKSLALSISNLTLPNSDSSGKEKLPGKNFYLMNLPKDNPTLIKKGADENISRDTPSKGKTGSSEFNDCKKKDVEKCDSVSYEKQIISSRKLEKVSESEIEENSSSEKQVVDNLNSDHSTDLLETSTLMTKPKNSNFGCNGFVNEFISSPPTIRRKRKYSASFREIQPRTTESSSAESHCDINQSSVNVKTRRKRRSYKKEEQNVILLSVLDYIVEEGKRNADFKEFQLPDSEYAYIKSKQAKKTSLSRDSCRKVENSSSCQSTPKTVGITKIFSIKDNPDSESVGCLEQSSNVVNSVNLEKSEHFQKHLPNPSESLQISLPEGAISTDSCKFLSQNVLDSVDMSNNIQECFLETESADTPRRIPKRNVSSKAKNCHLDSQDTCQLDNSKSFQKCLPFTKNDSAKNPQNSTLKHQPDTKFINCLQEFQERSGSLDNANSKDSEKYPSKAVDKTNHHIADLKSKTCLADSQDILDSVGLDESFSDRVHLLPQCDEGLSQFSITSSRNDSFVKCVSNDTNLTKRWRNTGIPADLVSKNKNHDNPDSLQEEFDSKTRFHLANNNKTNICSTIDGETAVVRNAISSQCLSEPNQIVDPENKNTTSTTEMTSCDNRNVMTFPTDKNPDSRSHSVSHPHLSGMTSSRHHSDHFLPSSKNISKCLDSQPEGISTSSLTVKTCVHNFSSFVCDSDKLNNKTFQNFEKADSFKLPGSNEEVVSLLNSRSCLSGSNDFSRMSKDLIICVTQYKIYLWNLTILGQWEIIHQQQITEMERCCHASLHPLENGIGVATVLVTSGGESQLVLHTFQMQKNIESKQLPVTLQQIHKLVYSCLNSCTMVIARTSNERTIEVCKYVLSENVSSIESIQMLDYSSDKLLSLNSVQGLPAALLGFTATYIVFIWNHVANVLLTKISLSDILVKPCMLPSAFTEQGHIVFPILFDDGPEQGCLLAINPNTDVVVKLLSYQRHVLPEKKSDSRMALILHENLLSVQDNVLGIWDLYSGSLMACVNSLGMTCMTLFCWDKDILLITGHKQSCLHIYRSHTLQHSSQPT